MINLADCPQYIDVVVSALYIEWGGYGDSVLFSSSVWQVLFQEVSTEYVSCTKYNTIDGSTLNRNLQCFVTLLLMRELDILVFSALFPSTTIKETIKNSPECPIYAGQATLWLID